MEFDILGIVFRWAHILAAITAVGGVVFMRLALLPATAVLSEEQRRALQAEVRSRWVMPLMIALAFLLVSGLYNIIMNVTRYDLSAVRYYHPLFGIKFLLALVIMWIAAALTGRSQATEKIRANARYWLTVNLILAVIVVCISGILRFAPRIPKTPEEEPAARESAPEAVELATFATGPSANYTW